MIKLNTIVTDSATGRTGSLQMMHIEMDHSRVYLFEPCRLQADGTPMDGIWLVAARVQGGVEIPDPVLPVEVLGTVVEDIISGYKGIAVSLVLHATGCVHLNVQGRAEDKDGNLVKAKNFSILRLKGRAIKNLSETERAAITETKPSPGAYSPPQKLA